MVLGEVLAFLNRKTKLHWPGFKHPLVGMKENHVTKELTQNHNMRKKTGLGKFDKSQEHIEGKRNRGKQFIMNLVNLNKWMAKQALG